MLDRDRLLQRFLRYVRIDTTADPNSPEYPSSAGQLELGRLLTSELQQLGLADARQDEYGLVTATVPGEPDAPVVVLNSHLDTSPEACGANIKPRVIETYDGADIVLEGDARQVISVRENPELAELAGATIITTDGTTLLGADDKAGIAVIMEAAAVLCERPELSHCPVRILFTCDEEIGRGVQHVDVAGLGGVAAYTLDGPGHGQIDVETFSADLATVTVRGTNIHPAIGKGRLVNSIRAAAAFVSRLPRQELAPEVTEGRDGFLHPYDFQGGVEKSILKVLLRDFDADALARQAQRLREIAADVVRDYPGCEVGVEVQRQYRNLREGLAREPRAVSFAEQAFARLGMTCRRSIIRGGTDGSQLTELGLPTPNLSTGQHNPHSPREFACLDEMVQAVEVLVELMQIWAGR